METARMADNSLFLNSIEEIEDHGADYSCLGQHRTQNCVLANFLQGVYLIY